MQVTSKCYATYSTEEIISAIIKDKPCKVTMFFDYTLTPEEHEIIRQELAKNMDILLEEYSVAKIYTRINHLFTQQQFKLNISRFTIILTQFVEHVKFEPVLFNLTKGIK